MDQDQDETMVSSSLQDKDQRLQWEPENGVILVVFLFLKCRKGLSNLQLNYFLKNEMHIFKDVSVTSIPNYVK